MICMARIHRHMLQVAALAVSLVGSSAMAQDNPRAPLEEGQIVPQSTRGLSPLWLQGTQSGSPSFLDRHWRGYYNIEPINPPDPHGAAGPKGIFHVMNRGVAYLKKNGDPYWSTNILNFVNDGVPLPNQLIDPRALYDPATGRYFVSVLEVPFTYADLRAHLHILVSKSSHPATFTTADWYRYSFEVTDYVGANRFGMDYPGLGIDASAVYVTGNMFLLPVTGAYFRNVKVMIIDKLQAVAGVKSWRSVSTPPTVNGHGAAFTLQPVSTIGPGPATAYFAEVPYGIYDKLRLWALPDPLGSGVLQSTMVTIPPTGGIAGDAPQCITNPPMHGLVRTWSPTAQGNVFLHDGDLWLCHTGVLGAKAAVRWYRVTVGGFPSGTPALAESGVIDGGLDVWTYQPAIGGNALGDVAIVYTQSDASTCPTIMATARSAQTGTFSTPVLIKTSPLEAVRDTAGDAQGGGAPFVKFGDYASVTEDPVDHSLWVTHEWIHTDGLYCWATEWGNIRFPAPFVGWPSAGRAVRSAQSDIRDAVAATDGSGGSIVAWSESRKEVWQLFVARVLSDGTPAPGWAEGGISIASTSVSYDPAFRFVPLLLADSLGGTYVGWVQNGHVRIQHIAASGAIAGGWPADGVAVGSGEAPTLSTSIDHSVIVAWDIGGAIALQRISADGVVQWGTGIVVGEGYAPAITPDGVGGAIVVWEPANAQRVTSSGVPVWTTGGVSLDPQGMHPVAVANGIGGATISWQLEQPNGTTDLYAQNLDEAGEVVSGWPAVGVAVCTASGSQLDQKIVAGASGGSILVWKDRRNAATKKGDLYAVALTSGGQVASGWTTGGTPICTALGEQQWPAITADGHGGALIAWQDRRAAPNCNSGPCGDDVYWVHVLAAGSLAPGFSADGNVLNGEPGMQVAPALHLAGDGIAIAAYIDGRGSPDCIPWCGDAVFESRVSYDTTQPTGVPEMVRRPGFDPPLPNPATTNVSLSWILAAGDLGKTYEVGVYDVSGRRVRRLAGGVIGSETGRLEWSRDDDQGRRVAAGVYFLRLTVGSERYLRTLVLH
jgi:hypothetical protein